MSSLQDHAVWAALIRREQAISAAINCVLSAAFFALMFGFPVRVLAMTAPDAFAVDWLPQGMMVSLMAALVPSLLVRARLRREGCDVPLDWVFKGVAISVLAGLVSGGSLALLCRNGQWGGIDWFLALVLKLGYGAGLGVLVTRGALNALLRRAVPITGEQA